MGESALLILESWSPEQFMFRHTIYKLVFMKLIRSYLSQGLAKCTTSTSNGVVEVGLTLKEKRNKVVRKQCNGNFCFQFITPFGGSYSSVKALMLTFALG